MAPVHNSLTAGDLHLSGTLDAERSLTLSFAVPGTVTQVLVQEGATVKRGQVLARISPRSYQDALGIAKVKLNQAEDAYRRLKPMYDNHTLPEVKMVEVESGREQARLAVSMAGKNLADTALVAPEGGIVAHRHAEPGTSAGPGLPIVTLVHTATLLATAPVPEKHVAQVRTNDPAQVAVPAVNKTFDGVVRDIGVMADPLTRTYPVKIEINNQAQELRIGMIADVRLRIGHNAKALTVPPEAIRIDEQGDPCVYVVASDNRARRRKVKVIGFVGEQTAIAAGVEDGDLVVTSGTPMLADGMAVKVIERAGDGA